MSRTVVSLVVFAGVNWGCGEPPLEPRDPTPGVAHFRFTTYNVHYPEARDSSTIAAIRATHGDIVCLQETNAEWRDSLFMAFANDYPYIVFQELEEASGLGVLSRFPLIDQGILEHAEGWHPGWHLTVETPAGPIELLHVHLRASFDGEGNPITSYLNTGTDHVQQVRSYVKHLSAELPRVVLGDFNEGIDGASIEFLEGKGYRNALPLYHPGQPTWLGTSVGEELELTVDHVLFDRRFAPLNAYALNRGGSDHLPVVAHLEAARGWGGAR
jgi:endonuclease/exonuclease/phosphatase family metal-dependent hydrolase